MYKKNFKVVISSIIVFIFLMATLTYIVDPFFHYHKPIFGINDYFYNQRYQNYGISKQYEYTSIITGTSMTENFKASEFDRLFNETSIKTSFSGASLREINEYLEYAISRNEDISIILRGIDLNKFLKSPDDLVYEYYPNYLYDENILNDLNYLLNLEILINDVFNVLIKSIRGDNPSNFDSYSNWEAKYTFSKEEVLSTYQRNETILDNVSFTKEDEMLVIENFYQNVTSLAIKHPDFRFIYFIPPYSILYFDELNQAGQLNRELEAMKVGIREMINVENIELYAFFDEFDVITDLNNYKDILHYNESINSLILNKICNEENLITSENIDSYLEEVSMFYLNYDYESLFN